MRLKSILLRVSALILLAFMGYGIYQLWNINHNYAQEASIYNQVQQYRPVQLASASSSFSIPLAAVPYPVANDGNADTDGHVFTNSASITINQSIVDLQAKYPDAQGWLTVPNTRIDYPFVQGDDNERYLHTDLEQNSSSAGTLFIDYRNSNDFSDFNTIFFGHHMRNGSMFGSLKNFSNRDFFEANRIGMLFLKDKTYEIEFFAFAVIKSDDGIIYNPYVAAETERADLLDYVKNTARHYRNIGVTTDDRLITLSTCNYEFEDARMVVIGRIVEG